MTKIYTSIEQVQEDFFPIVPPGGLIGLLGRKLCNTFNLKLTHQYSVNAIDKTLKTGVIEIAKRPFSSLDDVINITESFYSKKEFGTVRENNRLEIKKDEDEYLVIFSESYSSYSLWISESFTKIIKEKLGGPKID